MAEVSSEVQAVKRQLADVQAKGLRLYREGTDTLEAVRAYTGLVDEILVNQAAGLLAPDCDGVAVVAVGGYGRKELCPYSDIDLLFLIRDGYKPATVPRLVQRLWDAGFQPGQSLRTPNECYSWMVDDIETATALVEDRFLWGNSALHEKFQTGSLSRFRGKRRTSFIKQQLALLEESLDNPKRSIYVTEPNPKEGMAGLRDIQRVRWIENMCGRAHTFPDLLQDGSFAAERVELLREAYAFYLRVRVALHFGNNTRLDVLERDSQAAVARELGYADGGGSDHAAVEALMSDYYRHARSVYRFLRFYLETETRGRRFYSGLTRRFFSESVSPFLSLYRGQLFLSGPPPHGGTPDEILNVFRVAQQRSASFSEEVREALRTWAQAAGGNFTHSAPVLRMFMRILEEGRDVGLLLKRMNEAGVLERIIPEFGRLNFLVSFDGHHHFTVHEHTLKTLQEFDRIAMDEAYKERIFRRVYEQISDPLALRLALLLHDIGKGFPGDHSVSGTELSHRILTRLGVDGERGDTVEFLVYRHLELFNVSQRRDISEPEVIEGLARLVKTEARLNMLYLLTYIDVTSVGPGTWTRWKGAQLAEVYQRTREYLRSGKPIDERLEDVVARAKFSLEEKEKVLNHCRHMNNPAYVREVLPRRLLAHAELAEAVSAEAPLQVAVESYGDYHEVVFCGFDHRRLFANLSGLLFSEGFNILGARIAARDDNLALNRFEVEMADGVRVGIEARLERLRRKIDSMVTRTAFIPDVIRQRMRIYRQNSGASPLYGPSVVINNEGSERHTIIELNAPDRPGLLYDLATTLYNLDLDVCMAKVSTFEERVHDVFYVLENDRAKVDNPARRLEIELALRRAAIRPGDLMGMNGGTYVGGD